MNFFRRLGGTKRYSSPRIATSNEHSTSNCHTLHFSSSLFSFMKGKQRIALK